MSPLMASSLGVGICCVIWPLIANLTGLSIWIGFAGCTSYFVCGGWKTGLIKAFVSNYTGMFWAWLIFALSGLGFMQGDSAFVMVLGALAVGFISWGMTYQSRVDLASFVPATFIGCFSSFGAGGDWKMLAICFVCGHILGLGCSIVGEVLSKMFVKQA